LHVLTAKTLLKNPLQFTVISMVRKFVFGSRRLGAADAGEKADTLKH
jgi:hypothetical protein